MKMMTTASPLSFSLYRLPFVAGSWQRWSPMTARCSLCYCCTLQCPELSSRLQWSPARGQRCWSDAVFHQGPPPRYSEPGRMLGFLWWVKPSAGRERASVAVTPLYLLYPCPRHHFGPRTGLPSVVVFSWGLTPRCPFEPWPVWTKEKKNKHKISNLFTKHKDTNAQLLVPNSQH